MSCNSRGALDGRRTSTRARCALHALLLLSALAFAASAVARPIVGVDSVRMSTGDRPDWADPSLEAVLADPKRLEQAVQNLVANAVRHSPDGGQVSVEIADRGNAVAIVVQDTGPGIPVEHLPRVFDRFYKADESRAGTEVPSGSGLGLSIVQAIVVRHGGSVTAANAPEGGARFEILLPRMPILPEAAPIPAEPPADRQPTDAGSPS